MSCRRCLGDDYSTAEGIVVKRKEKPIRQFSCFKTHFKQEAIIITRFPKMDIFYSFLKLQISRLSGPCMNLNFSGFQIK